MKRLVYSLGFILTIGYTSPAFAGYIQTLGVDENCVAVGGACVAKEGDLGSYYINPAGAADITRPRIGMNLRVLDTRNLDLIDPSGNNNIDRTNTKGAVAVAPTIAGYIPVAPNVTAGIAIGAPFAITADWENGQGTHRYNMSNQALFVLDISPTIGIKVSEKLSVGASLSVTAFKHLRTETLIPDSFGAALPPSLGGNGTIIPTTSTSPIIGSITLQTNKDFGIGLPPDNLQANFNEFAVVLGARYKVNDALAIGISGRTRTKSVYKGTTTLSLGPTVQTTPFSLRLDSPGHIQAGIEFKPMPGTELSFDYQRTFWSDAVGFGSPAVAKFEQPLLGFLNDLQIDYKARDADTYRFGVRQSINPALSFSLGYAKDKAIFPKDRVDILTYDSDRDILSGGVKFDTRAGKNTPGWVFSLSAQWTLYKKREFAIGESANLGGVSLPNLVDADTLGFTANRTPFQFGGNIRAISLQIQKIF